MNYTIINSKYRTKQSDDPANCEILLPQILKKGNYQLSYVLLPNAVSTVNSSNNKLYLFENGIEKEAIISTGFYTNLNISDAVKTALDIASSGYNTFTVILDDVTKKLTISANNQFRFNFNGKVSTAYEICGFTKDEDSVDTVSLTAAHIVNLSSLLTLNISIDNLVSMDNGLGQGSSFIVPIVYTSLSLNDYESPPEFQQILEIPTNRRTIKIKWHNDLGEDVNFSHINFLLVMKRL
jgi:hypothetical protein